MIIDRKLLADSKPTNWVMWFMEAIKKFGGEYKPFRDTTKGKKHTSGRRETRLSYYSLNIVSAAKAAVLSPYILARRRTYTQEYQGGPLVRIKLKH